MTHLSVRDDMADLYHASYRRLVAQVYAFTTDLSEAQDAVQEAFARALARPSFGGDIDAPEAWLRTVAINIVRRRWRRRQLLNTIMLRERPLARMVEEAPSPAHADLRDALAAIPRAYREVIVLHYLADLPVDEVAAILEVPVGTVKSRLSRGREALKGLLDDVEAPPLDQVKQRARTIRTRRRVAQAGAALAVVAVSAVLFFPFDPQTTVPPAESSPPVTSYSGAGLTLRSVPEVGTAPDLPGTIDRFEISGTSAYLSTTDGARAVSIDGGQTWVVSDQVQLPDDPAPLPDFPHVWAHQDPSGVLVAAGVKDGTPTVAYQGAGGWKTLLSATQGDGITATMREGKLTVLVLRGQTIVEVHTGDTRGLNRVPGTMQLAVNGEPVMLPDGRLLVADTTNNWQLSSDNGVSWQRVTTMPPVGSLRQTNTGYVALGLFPPAGWIAVSADGVNWQKLPIR
ncbi:RNA polymerase sigma factor [Allorhizocola rhizosphaerae]|uniref:RNA polymerase sigma factor n=1 Tax=Allorhizocola rhizosphaerae TaxID=1872709 RepID=UPI001FE5EFDD|nr:RNA polymerase sigma factor [Allorhizocola rhizosphaerae]